MTLPSEPATVMMTLRTIGQMLSLVLFATLLQTSAPAHAQTDSTSSKEYTDAAIALYERAEHAMERKDYDGARRRYKAVAREYPFSIYAARAELRIGDAYFKEKSYSAAVEAYRAFARLRPRHELVPYADYQIVECYVRMMPKQRFFNPPVHERDLTDALLAYREARRYIIRYPEGEYLEQAKETVSKVADRRAEHELSAAKYYERRDKHLAAMRRYEYLVNSFPESTQIPQALLSMAKAAEKTHHLEKVQQAVDTLETDYADAEEIKEARTVLTRAEAFAEANPDVLPEGEGDQEENDPTEMRKYKGAKPQQGGAPAGGGMGGGMGGQTPGTSGMPY